MRFRTYDGEEHSGRSYREIVVALAQQKLTKPRSLAGYRRDTARRCSEMYGITIDTRDNRKFILSLVEAELMERIG